jgi:hypothetical protein
MFRLDEFQVELLDPGRDGSGIEIAGHELTA